MGGVTLLVALFGFCGAKKESQCLLSLYSICVFIILLLQIAAIVFINVDDANISFIKEKISNKFCTNFDPGVNFSGSSMSIFAASLLIFSLMKLMLASSTLMNTMAAIWRRRMMKTQML